eukprot:9841360-Lingulodinium_polyedra.AAC.1
MTRPEAQTAAYRNFVAGMAKYKHNANSPMRVYRIAATVRTLKPMCLISPRAYAQMGHGM